MLVLCRTCARHHFATDACPFCAGSSSGRVAALPRRRTLARRAVSLAAGAVVLGTFGCAYGSPEPFCSEDAGNRDAGCSTSTSSADAQSDAPGRPLADAGVGDN
jgi:hypothetical protein